MDTPPPPFTASIHEHVDAGRVAHFGNPVGAGGADESLFQPSGQGADAVCAPSERVHSLA
jgi:hypothetical protein